MEKNPQIHFRKLTKLIFTNLKGMKSSNTTNTRNTTRDLKSLVLLLGLFSLLFFCSNVICGSCEDGSCTKRKVILDIDGGVDDFGATALLLTEPSVEVLAIIVTPGATFVIFRFFSISFFALIYPPKNLKNFSFIRKDF